MKLDRIIAVRNNKTIYRDGDKCIKVFNEDYSKSDILNEALNQARIGFYPGGDQITIPHYDKDGRFVGLRGRALSAEEAERFGKYRPIKINNQLYNHPLGMNLYNLNYSKENTFTYNFQKYPLHIKTGKAEICQAR